MIIHNSQLPHGYKQTEIGVIPEDWDVDKIDFLASMLRRVGQTERRR